jgi:hypothetical protein
LYGYREEVENKKPTAEDFTANKQVLKMLDKAMKKRQAEQSAQS